MEENGIPLSKAIPKLVSDQTNAILGANSFQEIYHALEEEGDKGEPKPKEAKKKTLKMLIEHRGLRIEHCSSLNVLITHWQGRQSFIMFCHLARTILILESESKY